MNTNDIARTAGLIGEPARTRMLIELIDGRALTAGELARAAGITAQTASRHLALLGEGGLISVTAQGRHRYHRLASAEVAAVLEGVMQLASLDHGRRRPITTGPRDGRMRRARTCYDHLAGRLGVAVTDHLVEAGAIELDLVGARGTASLVEELARIDLVAPVAPAESRALACRPCMDWAERRPHLAGPLATQLCAHVLARGWLRRPDGQRGLDLTGEGTRRLGAWLGARRWAEVVGPD